MASLFTATVIIIITMITITAARELRPSNHGLIFQNSSPTEAANSPMKSFFNYSSSTQTSSSSSDMPFPNSATSTESLPPPWRRTNGGGGGGRHWGRVWLIASLVCGMTGVTLLVAVGVLYLFIIIKRKRKNNNTTLNESFRDVDNDFNANQL